MSARVAALIVAAGRSDRFGADRPKQFLPLAGRAVLAHAVEAFRRHAAIGAIVVVGPEGRLDEVENALGGLDDIRIVPGGPTRGESVRAGLEALAMAPPEIVLIHDGARPLITTAVIDAVIVGVDAETGAIAALPVSDTLKRADGAGHIAATVDRDRLWRAQTPQGFPFARLRAAQAAATGTETDDAAVFEAAGGRVRLVAGDPDNLKITFAEDLDRAEAILAMRTPMDIRTGTGFDVHRLGPGHSVWLCGVEIPFERTLIGHSDADVGLHALVDAILGAIGAGDIGEHFPPTDERWRGAASKLFVAEAMRLLAERGGRIVNADVTLLAERPKINPHKAAMRVALADMLAVTPDRVNVKATTMEELGFVGREEGIAAQAVATVLLPG